VRLERVAGGVWRLVVGAFRVNTYISVGGGECLVVDPGDCRVVGAALRRLACRRGVVLVTHGHFDHVAGVACASSRGFRVGGHPMTPYWALDFAAWARSVGVEVNVEPFTLDFELADGARVDAAGLALEALHTPGHSPDHMVYVDHGRRLAFTGDLIFKGSIGRDDIPGASPEDLARSLARIAETLDPDYTLLPGHGPETTLGDELRSNMLLKLYIASKDGTHTA